MSDPKPVLAKVYEAVLEGMDLEGTVAVVDAEDGTIAVTIDGKDLDAMIGRDGAVIDALQYLGHQIAFRSSGGSAGRVNLDVGGYRDRRRRQLEKLAGHAADEAVRYGEEIELDEMTPHDRRIVHMALADRTDIETRSEGEEPHRRIVVVPADASGGQ